MRTIIAGSREGPRAEHLTAALDAAALGGWEPSVVLSGTARGADTLGEQWAAAHGVPIERFPADWTTHGKAAGYKRNAQMAANADALIALWDGRSRGTKHMIDLATRAGLLVLVFPI